MSTIKTKRDDTLLSNWESLPERAPSLERADRPLVARFMAMVGLFLLVLGGLAILAPTWSRTTAIGPGWGFFFATIGLCLVLFHAYAEHDFQFRRIYGVLGLALILGGVIVRLVAFRATANMPWFYLGGVPGMFVGLIILVAVIRNETDAYFRTLMVNLLGGLGALMIAYSLLQGLRDPLPYTFLPGEGVLLLLLGLLYVVAYIGQQELNSERGYHAALGLGAVGVLGFIIGMMRSLMPESNFLVPSGVILLGMSALYIAVALGACVDWPIIVLARRDLAAYFYSPIAYLVFVGILFTGWIMFFLFVQDLDPRRGEMFEPIVRNYIFSLWPVVVQMFFVPVLTMRLLSEEKRTGTLEVLMTAPVNEISVVLGKFLACWIFYMITWLPWWLFLVGLRYFGGEEFDYRPILSFSVALAATAGGLLSMGIFFSSLTSNQIIAAVLTFVGVSAHLAFFFIKFLAGAREGSATSTLLTYINFFDLWQTSLGGIIAPRYLLFHLSVTVFFLFATVKVLESRKWK
jgi:ABC-2 type transport system permease protein